MSSAKPQKKMWKKVRDAVNRNGIVRRISIRKSSRVKKYPSRAPDYEPEEKDLLLAQVYTLYVDGEQQRWERILDGIVTLSVACEQASPKYVYHITTVDSELQGLLDAYITVPGTQVVRCTSSFIQWKDSDQGGAWGLNFLSKDHADKFIDLCTPSDNPKLKRSNSSGCLSKTTELPTPSALDFHQHSASLDHLDDDSDSDDDDDIPTTNIDDITVGDSSGSNTPICTSTPTGSIDLRGNPLRLSGGVRRMLASRNSGGDIKYATYSASRRSKFIDSFYDNVDSDEDLDDQESSEIDDWIEKTHSFQQKDSKKYKETNIDDIRNELDALSDRTLQKTRAADRLNSPKRTLSKRSEAGSVASSSQSSNTPQQAKVVMEQGVLKSAKFVEENSSHFGLANAGKLPNSNDSLHDNRNSPAQEYEMEIPRPRTYTDSQATYSITEANDPIVRNKRTKSLYAGGPITLPPEDTSRNDSRNSDQSNELVREYEHELKLQALSENCDSGFDGMGPESETLTTRSTSSGQQSLLPKIRKRWGTGSDSGSSSGVRGDGGTLTSSEGRYSAHMDINFFEGKQFEDEEDGDEESESISSHHTQGSCFQQRGAIRKAGWLTVKSMLVQRKKKVERAAKRKWKDYWVCLKGTMLLFYHCDEKNAPDDTSEPKHVLVVEGSVAQAVPEHTKRDFIFCLSTAFGDAYLLQATTQIELENWITAIHSACSSAFARQHGKDDTLRLLKSEVNKLETQIDSESKMKKMAELQITVVKDARNKQAIVTQITQWDHNLEKFHLELYRLRCYMASLQGSELPNPKVLLACVSKPTKHALARLGIFSVSSFHAIVSSRNPMGLQGRFTKKSSKKQKGGLFGTLRRGSQKASTLHRVDMGNTQQLEVSPRPLEQEYDIINAPDVAAGMTNGDLHDNTSLGEGSQLSREDSAASDVPSEGATIKVTLPNNQSTMVTVKPGMTVHDLLVTSCMHRQMDHHNYYVRLKQALKSGATYNIPDKMARIYTEKFDEIEICAKSIHQVELYRFDENKTFGFSLAAELGDDAEQEDQLCVFISEIEKGGMAYHQDLQVGDEMLVINGSVVCDQDMLFIENLLHSATTLTMTIRSCRSLFAQTQAMVDTNRYIDQLTCPPPPSQTRLTDEMIDNLIVPAPLNFDENDTSENSTISFRSPSPMKLMYDPVEEEPCTNQANITAVPPNTNPQEIADLLKNAEQITEFCRLRDEPQCEDDFESHMENSKSKIQVAQKLRKVIVELIDTEKTYVKDLNCLVSRYLEPLQNESFLSADEIDALFGNVKEIIKFQSVFLKALNDATELASFDTLEHPSAFKRILIALSGAFLFHMDHFKLYSSFCACHSRAQKILDPSKGNQALNDFLDARNPKHQHSSSLSSYLIKPIQRVLKYPLLLREIRSQLDNDSEEHYHLSGALRGMEEVAGHINDMMRVHEEYGDIFDSLVAQQYHVKKELVGTKVADLAMDDLVMYNMATWLNAEDEIGKVKKGKEPEVMIFVFRPAVVIIFKEKGKKKKMSIVSGTASMKALPPEDIIRYKWMIPISLLQLKDSSISDSDYLSLWEVIHTKSDGRAHEKVFQFSCNTTELKNTYIKSIRQCLRDYNRIKNMPNASKFTKSKNYTPYGGKRFEGLSRPKRTLRKTLKSGESGSQGSEERSSESGSREDESMDTDSNSTGTRLSMYKIGDMYDPFRLRSDSMGSKGSRGSRGSVGSKGSKGSKKNSNKLNTNSNNNTESELHNDGNNTAEFLRCDSNNSDVFLPETPRSFQSDCTLQGSRTVVDDELFCAEIASSPSPTAEEINQRLKALDLSLTCQQLSPCLAQDKTVDGNHSSHYPGDIATINRTIYKDPSTDKRSSGKKISRPSSLYDNLDKIGHNPSAEDAFVVALAGNMRSESPDGSEQSGHSSSFEV